MRNQRVKDYKHLIYTPDEWQPEAIDFGLAHHYCIIGDDMGLGKSFEAGAVVVQNDFKILVISPAHLKRNWWYEFKAFQNKYSRLEGIFVCKTAKDLKRNLKQYHIVIINFEMLLKEEDMRRLFQDRPNVIVDEAHYLKNIESQRTKAFHTYVEDYNPHRVLLCTGTAIKNRVDEFYSLLLICSYNPAKTSGTSILGMSYYHFRSKFMWGRRDKFGYMKWSGLRNKEKLLELLEGKYIRREAEDVLGLSPLLEKSIMVDYASKGEEKLKEAWEKFQKTGKMGSKDVTVKVESAVKKAPFTAKYVKGLLDERDTPVVVFTDHLDPLDIIYERLLKLGIKRIAKIDGDTPMEQRDEYVRQLQARKLDVLMGTILTMGTGNTMTEAIDEVFNDPAWVPGDNKQAKRRIWRRGTTKACTIHHISGSPMDKYINEQLISKEKVIKEVL